MKILHLMLSCFYIDGYSYQENMLPKQNKIDGHIVKIVASTETYKDNISVGYVSSGKYYNTDGILVQRVKYNKLLPRFIMNKIRAYEGVYKIVEEFDPDIILFHGVAALELLTIAKYKKTHKRMRLFVDNHTDKNNSGRNVVSMQILHKVFYRSILKMVDKEVDKYFYISKETKDFLVNVYKVDKIKLEYFPIGSILVDEDESSKIRKNVRNELGISESKIVILHSGKIDKDKKTIELLNAFSAVKNDKLVLIIIGSIQKNLEDEIYSIISKDKRIQYLGWKSSQVLLQYLYACDIYAQPGSQSVILQAAICANAAILAYPHRSYFNIVNKNGAFVKNEYDIFNSIKDLSENQQRLMDMKKNSNIIAKEILDYKEIAKKMYC